MSNEEINTEVTEVTESTEIAEVDSELTEVSDVTPKSTLAEVAEKAQNDLSIANAVTSQTLDNLKIFQIVYSRSQLERVVKLTSRLQELEDRLLDRAEEVTDLYDLMNVIKLIQGSLDRALEAIKQITRNEEYLQVVIQNANIVNTQLNNYTSINSTRDLAKVHNQDSREKIRSAISSMIDLLSQDDTETIDMEDTNNGNG